MSEFNDREHPEILVLFDVDGTLTPARQYVTPDVVEALSKLRKKVVIGFVGGSDLVKQQEQLGADVLEQFDYAFSENGLTAYKLGKQLPTESFISWMGEDRYNKFATWCLRYLSGIELPKRRGTFIEFRKGLVNVSPVGRNASQPERDEFEAFDKKNHIRAKMVEALKEEFSSVDLEYSIGGQISFDVFPKGWDKTYALRHVKDDGFKVIHFFGDKTMEGGNDYEIYHDSRVTGHAVKTPKDTVRILHEIFGI